ncbi:O-antigen ligase family protein [Halomonas sp. H10-59]|uniref:O-antigen ligase family protein n=1 Tax=Halomonas sp. H10-59 TaxID=2950874 RepID=A0AAU7KYT4_9GAMM
MSFSFFVAALSALLLYVSGFLELATYFDQRSARALMVSMIWLLSLVVFIYNIRNINEISPFHIIFIIFTVYATLVAVVRGGTVDAISPLLRLSTYMMFSLVFFNLLNKEEKRVIVKLQVFFLVFALCCICQTIYDYIFGRSILMNGANRYFGSVGSPVGFAAICFVNLCASCYFWINLRKNSWLIVSISLVLVVFMTATRATSVVGIFVLLFAVFIYLRKPYKIVFCILTPFFIVLVYYFFDVFFRVEDIGAISRLMKTLDGDALDNSSSFRMFILDTVSDNITIDELLFGNGLGSFNSWFLDKTGINGVAPHFEVLWIVFEFGLVPFVIVFIYSLSLLLISFLNYVEGVVRSDNFFIILMALLIPQVFLQLSNPFYFYQFVVLYSLISSLALSKLNIECFRIIRSR